MPQTVTRGAPDPGDLPPGTIPLCIACDSVLCECHHCPVCNHSNHYEEVGTGGQRLSCLEPGCGCLDYTPETAAYLPTEPDTAPDAAHSAYPADILGQRLNDLVGLSRTITDANDLSIHERMIILAFRSNLDGLITELGSRDATAHPGPAFQTVANLIVRHVRGIAAERRTHPDSLGTDNFGEGTSLA